jgi:hypothetical protein
VPPRDFWRDEASPTTDPIEELNRLLAASPPHMRGEPIGRRIEIAPPSEQRLFDALTPDDLLTIGVPTDWIADVRRSKTTRLCKEAISRRPASPRPLQLETSGAPMSTLPDIGQVSTTQIDGLDIRLVRSGATEGVPILLTSPWPESIS